MAATAPAPILTQQHIDQYREEGWCLLENAIPAEHLALLRGACQQAIDASNAEMDRLGVDVIGIDRRNSRYFSTHPSLARTDLMQFIRSPMMAGICRELLGPEAYVFWEQYVVKASEGGLHFGWHQDSGYVGDVPHDPFLTCWCALDDMSEANGTISVLPFSRAGRSKRPHAPDPDTNDLIGYHGDDPGISVVCPAGSIALFTSVTLHRSGANRTDRWRRSYLIQYSNEIIRLHDGKPWGRTEPVLVGGRPVPPTG